MFEARNSRILKITSLLIAVCCICVPTQAQYSGGTGEPNDPYQIATADDLMLLGESPDDYDKNFILTANINLSNYSGTSFNIIGTDPSNAFKGVFDGHEHKIINFTWYGTDQNDVGLFGCAKGAKVKNLGLESVYIDAPDCNHVGGLMGNNDWFSTISNCYVTGNITGKDKVGVLVGHNFATILNCYSQGSASGNEYIGGLVGNNVGGAIINCFSSSFVSGNSKIGGLVGAGGGVTNSFWDIEISSQLTSAGGSGKTTTQMKTADTYLGWAACDNETVWTLDESIDYPRLAWENKFGLPLPQTKLSNFLTGTGTPNDPYLVSTGQELNLIGLFTCEWDKFYKLTNDVNLADYTGTEFNIIGTNWLYTFTGIFDGQGYKIINFSWHGTDQSYIGLIGYLNGEIKNLGMESVEVNAPGCDSVGGLIAVNRGVISNCYVSGNILGNHQVGGLAGYNSAQLNGSDTGVIRDCYAIGTVSGDHSIGGLVGMNYNESTISNCYSQSNVSGYYRVGGLVGSNDDKSTIYDSYAAGNVSGESQIGGLVGENNNESIISNSNASASVTANGYNIGGLAGYNYNSTILNSYTSASVTGNGNYIGGLAGYNYNSAIYNSYSKSDVSGNNNVGGLVGIGYDCIISRSYSEGSADGNEYVGGLVGSLNGTIYNSYSTGFILGNEPAGGLVGSCSETSIISDSFWDIESSNQNSMCGRSHSPSCIDSFGKTTAEMQTAGTFLNVGWDFMDETANGTDDIWWIDEGNDYPRLWWEPIEEQLID